LIRRVVPAAILAAATLAAACLLSDYYVYVLTLVFLAAMVTLGLVLLSGIGGLTSFGQAAFVGVAAYVAAVGATRFGLSPWLTLPLALGITGLLALLLGAVTVNLSGHYLPLGTLAWGLAMANGFGTVPGLGRYDGIGNLPPLNLLGWVVTGPGFLLCAGLMFLIVLTLAQNLLDSREGRALRATGTDRLMPECMGVNTARVRLVMFVLAAVLAAFAGWAYAQLQRFVSPSPFGIDSGLEYLFMAIIGGSVSLWGALGGAAVIIWAKELLRLWLPALVGRAGDFDLVVFSGLMILLMQSSPAGLGRRMLGVVKAGGGIGPKAVPTARPSLQRDRQPGPGTPVLQVVAVEKRFGGLVANHDVSLEAASGEILAVIGPNGAGKSTLFNMLSGVTPPTAGRISLLGTDITRRGARAIAGLGLGRTFQHAKLTPDMTVLENIALGAYRLGRSGLFACLVRADRREDHATLSEARRLAALCGLGDQVALRAASLPLGSRRLVEVARALAGQPKLLLLDEPAAGLRAPEKAQLAALLADLRATGLAILLVEHDMEFVMGLADRIVVMNFGEIIARGSPAAVQTDPSVIAAYLGVPA